MNKTQVLQKLLKIGGRQWKDDVGEGVSFKNLLQYVSKPPKSGTQRYLLRNDELYFDLKTSTWYRSPETRHYFNEIKRNIMAKAGI